MSSSIQEFNLKKSYQWQKANLVPWIHGPLQATCVLFVYIALDHCDLVCLSLFIDGALCSKID